MKTNKNRLRETLWDMIELDRNSSDGISERGVEDFVDHIMDDIALGIIAPGRPGA